MEPLQPTTSPPPASVPNFARISITKNPANVDCALLQPPKLACNPPTPGMHASFAERRAQTPRPSPLTIVKGDKNMRDIERPPPGDVVTKARRAQPKPDLARQRSNYFEDAFSTKDANPAKTRVRSEAIVMADVKTNVIITDEFTFITELSYHLSTRYQRPINSIVVTLHHGACMLFGGTFDPAYIMSVFALPSQLQPTTNKRNAALIQKHMEEAIGVTPSRGFLQFVPTPEEHTAWNGKTLAGEIDDMERHSLTSVTDERGENGASGRQPKPKKRLSVRGFGASKSAPATIVPGAEPTPPASADNSQRSPTSPTAPQEQGEQLPVPARTAKRSKSFMALVFGRT